MTDLLLAAPIVEAGPVAAGLSDALGPLGKILDPNYLIEKFGDAALYGIVAVVFIETGLLFPFLPGDSLLFTAGMLVAQGKVNTSIWLMCTMLFCAAWLGDQCSYWIGRTIGYKLFRNPKAKILKPEYLTKSQEFFAKYGTKTIILARFVPFVRTYAPVALGMSRFEYKKFMAVDVIGALLWAVGVTLIGYFLGNIPAVKNNLEVVILLIVFVSVLPIIIEVAREKLSQRKAQKTSA